MKILLISLAGIGDSLLATPLIQALRQAYPDARLDVLVMWGGARQLLEGNPHVTTVYQENLLQMGVFRALKYLGRFRREHYDVSINVYPQGKIIYRITARYMQAKRRLSHIYENRSPLDRLLVTDILEQDYEVHCIENNLNFLKLLGLPLPAKTAPEIYFSPAERQWAEEFVRSQGLAGKRILGVHVGSGKTKNLRLKRWPVEHYAVVLKKLLANYPQLTLLLFGGPEEKTENEILLNEVKSERLLPVPSRTFKEATAVLGKCELFLSVDNVFMHLAATMKVPRQIVIESPTWNKTIEPYQRPYKLVRNPMVGGRNLDYYRYDGRDIQGGEEHLLACMRSITPEMVLEVVEEALR